MYDSQKIAERIKQRTKEQGLTISQLLSDCGLGINTISKMAKGTDILTLNFAKIADALQCSTDYLLCRTDDPTPPTVPEEKKEWAIFTERFNQLLQKNEVTPYKVAKETGISQGLMGEYKQGKKIPTVQNLVKIADFLQCSTDYLLGRTDKPDILKWPLKTPYKRIK